MGDGSGYRGRFFRFRSRSLLRSKISNLDPIPFVPQADGGLRGLRAGLVSALAQPALGTTVDQNLEVGSGLGRSRLTPDGRSSRGLASFTVSDRFPNRAWFRAWIAS